MGVEVKVPTLGESVTQATVSKWLKKAGESVAVDEPLVELETDKVTVEVNAPVAGAIESIAVPEGSDVGVGALLATIAEGAAGTKTATPAAKPAAAASAPKPAAQPAPPQQRPVAQQPAPQPAAPAKAPSPQPALAPMAAPTTQPLPPAVRKLVEEHRLDPAAIPATGPGGRLTKGDVLAYVQRPAAPAAPTAAPAMALAPATALPPRPENPREERVKLTKLRRMIAQRLKDAQNAAAMLTTYNEVDMSAAMDLRNQFKDAFEKKYQARLGFMSLFVRASCIALKEWPAVNAEIYGDEIVYKNFYHIGVAVGSPQGLVVPVIKDADKLSFGEIEVRIADFGRRARDGKLRIDEMTGGTFTISNGGVFGSLMSMPILNPPQSGILGMHKIEKRARVVGDEIVARPMMYLALTYDHRIIDGREAVSFLSRLKDLVEGPTRILIDI